MELNNWILYTNTWEQRGRGEREEKEEKKKEGSNKDREEEDMCSLFEERNTGYMSVFTKVIQYSEVTGLLYTESRAKCTRVRYWACRLPPVSQSSTSKTTKKLLSFSSKTPEPGDPKFTPRSGFRLLGVYYNNVDQD